VGGDDRGGDEAILIRSLVMTIYVDDMYADFGRMKMCHMVSDLLNYIDARIELDEMADKCGVQRKWIQEAGTPQEHYDVAIVARKKAVAAGAIECEVEKVVEIIQSKRPVKVTP
jgi:hypothetical protein